MSFPFKKQRILLFSICLIFVCSQFAFAGDEIEWKPITPTELSMKKPVVEDDADAEAIFWDITLDDKKRTKMTMYHYVRVKIFTERGREKFSKFNIPFVKGVKIQNVAARVIKSDGSINQLKPSDIFEREIVKAGKLKVKAKSFAVPNIEPGVIVEYQYEEIRRNDSVSGERLSFQRDIPLQRVSYYIRPYKGSNVEVTPYNMSGDTRFSDARARKGFQVLTRTNVPSLKDEPYMPPDDEVRKWVYLRYVNIYSLFNWSSLGRGSGTYFNQATKPNKQIKEKAKELTAGSNSEEEKLRKIYNFVQKEIKNVSFDTTMSAKELGKLKEKKAGTTLKRGMASSGYIDLLFASLAKAAGFDANLVLSGDRRRQFFHPNRYKSSAFIHPCCVAVKVNNNWQFFNPGTPYLPFGKLIWYEQNAVSMLVADRGGYAWKTTNLSEYKETKVKRSGKLKLSTDGTLEGNVKFEYSGHYAIERRRDGYTDSEDKRKEDFKKQIKRNMSTAEVTNISIQDFADNEKPLVYTFNLRVPNYAQKAGSRIFFKPGVFESGASPVFSAATRVHPIYFRYPWSQEDDLIIDMPEGYSLDSAGQPGDVADPSKIGSLEISIGVNKATKDLVFKRKFHFGAKGNIYFEKSVYTPLKNLFDLFHKADSHTLALKKDK